MRSIEPIKKYILNFSKNPLKKEGKNVAIIGIVKLLTHTPLAKHVWIEANPKTYPIIADNDAPVDTCNLICLTIQAIETLKRIRNI